MKKDIIGSGGGGCFHGDTLIAAPDGDVKISDIKVGDYVYSFNDFGEVSSNKVTAVFEHEEEPIYEVKFWNGSFKITNNHWVLNQYYAFVEVGTLTPDDCLVDHRNHLRPVKTIEYLEHGTVYNLTVEENHTFIADGIRVHNGGKGTDKVITGAGGGGGKGGGGSTRVPVEDPDSLRSVQYAEIIDVICEGEIAGLVNGYKSIYLDNTPMQNTDNSWNFANFAIVLRPGTPTQTWVSEIGGFGDIESENVSGTLIDYNLPIEFTISNPDVNKVRVNLGVPRLIKQDKDDGDLHGTIVYYAIDTSIDGGGWTNRVYTTFNGKCTTKYQRSHEIGLSGATSSYGVRVRRLTGNRTASNYVDKIYLDSYTEIISGKFAYPNTAYAACFIDSRQFGRIPTRAYELKLLKVQIPSNYNPTTRTYTGEWDGNFAGSLQWTDNPAWCFYDIVTNDRYGLGQYLDAAVVDKWSLYTIAQYCDELVDDGQGGQEPRFTCNVYLQTREDALRVIRDMASIFRGMLYWSADSIVPVQDAPDAVYAQFTNADIIDGQFNYQGSAARARHNVALVGYNDPNYGYQRVIEYVEDTDFIGNGINETEVVAFGCTSRGQAHRLGQWILYAENYETEIVQFKTSFEGTQVAPGVIIQTLDQYKAGARHGGRLVQAYVPGTQYVVIDTPVTLEPGETYSISITLGDGTIATRVLTNPAATTDTLIWTSGALDPLPIEGAIWVLTASNLFPETWRVISVTEEEKHIYNITALSYNGSKYAAIEQGLDLEVKPNSLLTNTTDPVDTGTVVIEETLYTLSPRTFGTKIHVGWEVPDGAVKFIVRWRREEENYETITTYDNSATMLNQRPGTYTFSFIALNELGVASAEVFVEQEIYGVLVPPSDVTGFTSTETGNVIRLAWNAVPDIDVFEYEIREGVNYYADYLGTIGDYITTPYTEDNTPLYDSEFVWKMAADDYTPATKQTIFLSGDDTAFGTINYKCSLNTDGTLELQRPGVGDYYATYAGVSGDFVSTPDSVATSITGDIDIIVKAALTDWTPTVNNTLISKWTETGDQRSYVLWVDNTTGYIRLSVSGNGIQTPSAVSTSAPVVSDGADLWVRATLDVSTELVNFYTSDNGYSWTPLGSPDVALSAALAGGVIFDNTQSLIIGAHNNGTAGMASGKIYEAIVRNGINGTVVARFDASDNRTNQTTHVSSITGETWTWTDINSTTDVTDRVYTSSVAPILADGQEYWFRVLWFDRLYKSINSYAIFYYSIDNQQTWTQIGDSVTGGSTSPGNSNTTGIRLGSGVATGSEFTGKIYEFNVYNGHEAFADVIHATYFDASENLNNDPTHISSKTGETWTWTDVLSTEVLTTGEWANSDIVWRGESLSHDITTLTSDTTYMVKAKDIAGIYSVNPASIKVSLTLPSITSHTITFKDDFVILYWNAIKGTFAVKEYEVRKGGTAWGVDDTFIGIVESNTFTEAVTGDDIYRIKPIDSSGNYGAEYTISYTIEVPTLTGFTHIFGDGRIGTLKWTPTKGTLSIARTEIRYDGANWDAASIENNINGDSPGVYNFTIEYLTRTYRIKLFDILGNESLEYTTTVTVTPPQVIFYDHTFNDDNVVLTWRGVKQTLPISYYIIKHSGTNWADAVVIDTNALGNTYTEKVLTNNKTFRIKAVDIAGNESVAEDTEIMSINPPTVSNPSLSYDLGGNAILEWDSSRGSLATVYYEVQRGPAWDDPSSVILADGITNTSFVKPVNWQTTTLWIKAKDYLNNYSLAISIVSTIVIPASPVIVPTFSNEDDLGPRLVFDITPGAPLGTLPIHHYEIRRGGTGWGDATVDTGYTENVWSDLLNGTWTTRTYRVKAFDSAGNESTAATDVPITISPPTLSVDGITLGINGFSTDSVELSWLVTKGSLEVDRYEIRYAATNVGFDAAQPWDIVKDTVHVTKVTWKDRFFFVRAYDSLDLASNDIVINAAVTIPGNVTGEFAYTTDGNIVLSWDAAPGTLAIDHYVVKAAAQGTGWAGASTVSTVTGNSYSVQIDYNSIEYYIKAYDSAGNESATAEVLTVTIAPPVVSNPRLDYTQDSIVFSWEGKPGTLGIKHYEVKIGDNPSTWETSQQWPNADPANDEYVEGTSISYKLPVTTTPFDKIFRVKALDWRADGATYSTEANITATLAPPNAPTFDFDPPTFVNNTFILEWSGTPGDLGIEKYDLREGADWATGNPLSVTSGTNFVVEIDNTFVAQTYTIRAIDYSGKESATGSIYVVVSPPSIQSISAAYDGEMVNFTWTPVQNSMHIDYYEVRLTPNTITTWAAAEPYFLGFYDVTTFTTRVEWASTKVWVKAYDAAGNASAESVQQFDITNPSILTYDATVIDNNVLLRWSTTKGTLPTHDVEIRKGDTWEEAETSSELLIGVKSGTFTVLFENLGGLYTYWIAPIDTAGNYGTPQSKTVLVNEPPDYVLKQNWISDWSGDKVNAKVLGRSWHEVGMEPSEIDAFTETNANEHISAYTTDYYSGSQCALISSDTASTTVADGVRYILPEPEAFHRNTRTPSRVIRVSIRAKQPPTNAASQIAVWYSTNGTGDSGAQTFNPTTSWALYEFTYTVPTTNTGTDWLVFDGDTAGAGNGVLIDEIIVSVDGYNNNGETNVLLAPVDTGETVGEHFTTYTTPDAMIGQGYTYWITPTPSPATYEEIFDYGTVLNATKISVTPTVSTVGTPTITTEISVSDDNITYDTPVTASEVVRSGFRYVKVKLTIAQTGDTSFVEITQLSVKLDIKLKNDAGSGTVTATGGTTVNFNNTFIDVESINVTPIGTSAITAVVDFTDVVNPTSFDVYLFNASGTELSSGDFTWTARGY